MDHADVVLAKAAAIAEEAAKKTKNDKRGPKKAAARSTQLFHPQHQPVQVLPLQKPPPKILEIKDPQSKKSIFQQPPSVEPKAAAEVPTIDQKAEEAKTATPTVEIKKMETQKVAYKKVQSLKTDETKKAEAFKKNDQKKPADSKKGKAKKNEKKPDDKKTEKPETDAPKTDAPKPAAVKKADAKKAIKKDDVNPKKLDQQMKKIVPLTPTKTIAQRFEELKVDILLANADAQMEKKAGEEIAQDGRISRLSNRSKEPKKNNKKKGVAGPKVDKVESLLKVEGQVQASPGSDSSFEIVPLTDNKEAKAEIVEDPKPKLADNNNDDKNPKTDTIEETEKVAVKTETLRPPVAAARSKVAAAMAAFTANVDAAAQPVAVPKKPGKLASLRNFFESIGSKKNANDEENSTGGEQQEAIDANAVSKEVKA